MWCSAATYRTIASFSRSVVLPQFPWHEMSSWIVECLPHFLVLFVENPMPATAVTVVGQHLKVQTEACVDRNGSAHSLMALVSTLLPSAVKHQSDVGLTRLASTRLSETALMAVTCTFFDRLWKVL